MIWVWLVSILCGAGVFFVIFVGAYLILTWNADD